MEIRELISGASALFSIAMAVFGVSRAKRTADVTIAVDRALADKRMEDFERKLGEMEAELTGLKAGLDFGMGKVQDRLEEVMASIQKLNTTLAILVDRAERPVVVDTPTSGRRATKTGA